MSDHKLRMNGSGLASLFACLGLFGGCAVAQTSSTPASRNYGYIVLGPAAMSEFNISGGDTLPELRLSAVPQPARIRAATEAQKATYDRSCTRFFRAPSAFVALLQAKCGKGESEEDGERLMAVDASGELVGRVIPSLTKAYYAALHPENRNP